MARFNRTEVLRDEPLPLTYPYRLICNKCGELGRVGGPDVAYTKARKHEDALHPGDPGLVMIWEDG